MNRLTLAAHAFLLALPAAALAQNPPAIQDPRAWSVHDQNGPTTYEIRVDIYYPDFVLGHWVYVTTSVDTSTGRDVGGGVVLVPIDGDGKTCHAWSDDSGLWSRWVWDRNHYDKVGGSPATRSYHPAR